ncbi:AI-2E family transporter [Desulfobacter latus]|uniref:AI-2E family transporter n=1 Tax=Desulfobacter latus TaxID=2292 RepID=A0A850T8B6_9BACT|nr:AI-2E family transporter [Desulfobacter latus]NWH05712.1 AI-2E family transporter [Desulfobacter latus]
MALIGLGSLLHITKSFMVPFVIALLFAFLLIPVADSLLKLHIPSILVNTIVLVGFGIVLIGLVFLVYGALSSVSSSVPKYMEKYSLILNQLTALIKQYSDIDIMQDYKKISIEDLFSVISPSSVMKSVNQSVGNLISFMSRTTLMIIFLMFIVSSRKIFINKIYDFFHSKEDASQNMVEMIGNIAHQVHMYLFIKALISIGTGGVFGLVAWLFGLDFPFIWGLMGFVFNFIPTLGPIIATIPPIFLALLQFDSFWYAATVSFFMSAVQFISGSFVEPLIMGDRLNLNIIAILLSLLLWGIIWGIPGMILAVPITASLNIMLSNIKTLKSISILLSK